MADLESHEETPADLTPAMRSMVESAVRAAIERELVTDAVRKPEAALSFSRIFNKDAPDFSRLFSRGGTHLEDLKVRDLTMMEEEAFARFTDRVRQLQDMAPSEQPE